MSDDGTAQVAGCPVCSSGDRLDVLSLPAVPVMINAQVRPAAALDVARGDIDLVVCTSCGHLYNRSFDDTLIDYDAAYENTLHYSGHFQKFAKQLAERLVSDHGLQGRDVAELGSGPGHFLSMLCDAGVGRGFGFDPSYDSGRLGSPDHESVTVTTEMFPADGQLAVAFAFSQHVLEHLGDPVAALSALRAAVGADDGVVYSEVPNGRLMIEQCALWDLIYEHRSFFVPTSLDEAHRRAGLRTIRVDAAFDGQFLWSESKVGDRADAIAADADAVDDAVATAVDFGAAAIGRIAEASGQLASASEDGPVVLWGAGSKGMTYLNLVDHDRVVAAVVDINPRKAGWGVPGTGQTISGPEVLTEIQPQLVLVANPTYIAEIGEDVRRVSGRDVEVRALWGDDNLVM